MVLSVRASRLSRRRRTQWRGRGRQREHAVDDLLGRDHALGRAVVRVVHAEVDDHELEPVAQAREPRHDPREREGDGRRRAGDRDLWSASAVREQPCPLQRPACGDDGRGSHLLELGLHNFLPKSPQALYSQRFSNVAGLLLL